MAYLAKFQDDIFISYSHFDDEPLIEGQPGWVSSFHRTLEVYLRRRLGVDPEIWRDIALGGNEVLWDKLKNEIKKVAILVSIISPRYLESKSCLTELRAFCAVAEESGGLRVADDKTRLFKVLPTLIPLERHPPEVKDFIGYEFFRIDVMTNKPREFDPALGEEAQRKYLEKISDLAYDVAELLSLLKRREAGEPVPAAAGPVVYLAETTSDQNAARDAIRRELQERGCTILPSKPLIAAPDFTAAVEADLARAQLSIHLIGQNYGLIPEREERSIVDLQNEVAVQRGGARIVWLPPGLEPADERQQKFLEYLKSDPAAQSGVEFIEGSLDKLKTCVGETLAALQRPAPEKVLPNETGPPRVYLICDPADAAAVAPLADHLFAAGLETILPATEGEEAQVREDHKENLSTCDAVVIYQGTASEIWLRTKRRDLQKAAAFRTRPLQFQAIVLGPPETPGKAAFRTHEAEVIRMPGAFDAGALAQFVGKILEAQAQGKHGGA